MRNLCRALILLLPALALACGGRDVPPGTLEREAFVEVWVELRAAAAQVPEGQMPAERARILQERGITEEDLVTFVEVHGTDIPFMNQVWADVLERLEERGVGAEEVGVPFPRPDTAG